MTVRNDVTVLLWLNELVVATSFFLSKPFELMAGTKTWIFLTFS